MKRGHHRNIETNIERNKHTSRLLDQLGPEGRVGENTYFSRPGKLSKVHLHAWLFSNPCGKVLIVVGISWSPDLRVQFILLLVSFLFAFYNFHRTGPYEESNCIINSPSPRLYHSYPLLLLLKPQSPLQPIVLIQSIHPTGHTIAA